MRDLLGDIFEVSPGRPVDIPWIKSGVPMTPIVPTVLQGRDLIGKPAEAFPFFELCPVRGATSLVLGTCYWALCRCTLALCVLLLQHVQPSRIIVCLSQAVPWVLCLVRY